VAVQYELRQQVVEPKRPTFQHLIDRFGDRPATRYEEGTIDIQAREHFHYRPLWGPEHEIYGDSYSALRLADPYSFLDPRQFYYFPYTVSRAALHEAFGNTLSYIGERNLFDQLPAEWRALVTELVVPLRHYEAGAQLLSSSATRFANGTSISQCASFAAFDRIANAQMLSRLGLAITEDGSALSDGKRAWLDDEPLQGLRRTIETLLVEQDWAVGLIGLELIDAQLYPLLYRHLDETALLGGAGAYSLVAQHFAAWYADQRRWLDALVRAWLDDPEYGATNKQALADIAGEWLPKATDAVAAVAARMDELVPEAKSSVAVTEQRSKVDEALRTLGAM
jgi:phenol hydroxylase P1 protein